jgi:simple sugar transport system ATP-binding protein
MPAVEMHGIDKHFGAVQALSGVDLSVEPGTIHALIGENGAGKTTLMRILYGAIRASAGSVTLDGKAVDFTNSAQAILNGIGMVSQHYAVIPELSNIQNLMLGAETGWLIRSKAAIERADELAARMGFTFDWQAPSSELSPAGAQKLEILKLLWRNARIMILDEPTAMLSPADSDALFESLGKLTAQGSTVILVTHRLLEVVSHCKHVSVLRGGKLVADQPVGASSVDQLAELIVGRTPPTPPQLTQRGFGKTRLQVTNLSARGYRGDLALNGLELEVREGELLGIAGVDGNGQRELFQVLTGELKPERGQISWDEVEITKSTIADRLAKGFRVIPEDRHEEGVVDDWPLEENAAIGSQREAPFASGAKINVEGRKKQAELIALRLGTKHGGLSEPMSSLSGGNQQRFVAGRVLCREPKLVLAFQPARGLDIDATSRFYGQVRALCKTGSCAIVVSFDLDEVLENCDRVAVMHAGKISMPEAGKEHDRQAIGKLMVGAHSL